MPNPEAFWSYAHRDDEAENGRIVQLARDITAQYEMITGETLNAFVDRDSIALGENWREQIDRSLVTAAFFVPILTPRYFMRSECRRELQTFAREAERLGVRDLILSLYYVDVPELSDGTTEDDLIKLINTFQRQDWRELRFADRNSSEYRKATADFAKRLVDANRKIIDNDMAAVVSDSAKPSMSTPDSSASDDEPGLIDVLAIGQDALPAMNQTIVDLSAELSKFNEYTNQAVSGIKTSDEAGKGAPGRLAVARELAQRLAEPAEHVFMLANNYSTQMYDIDPAVRTLISMAPKAIEDSPDERATICTFFDAISTMAKNAHDMVTSLGGFQESLTQGESLSRDLRPPLRKIKQGLTIIVEASSVTDGWAKAIADSPVDCKAPV
jgi:hypothetical protein